MMEWFQETTGIYGLGFAKESFLGLMIPLVIFGGVAVIAFGAYFLSAR